MPHISTRPTPPHSLLLNRQVVLNWHRESRRVGLFPLTARALSLTLGARLPDPAKNLTSTRRSYGRLKRRSDGRLWTYFLNVYRRQIEVHRPFGLPSDVYRRQMEVLDRQTFLDVHRTSIGIDVIFLLGRHSGRKSIPPFSEAYRARLYAYGLIYRQAYIDLYMYMRRIERKINLFKL